MKQTISLVFIIISFIACNNSVEKGRFTVSGEIKNIPDQKIFLEELFFSQKDPEVLDTAEVKKGKFSIAAISNDEGLYRLRLSNNNTGFIFINDKEHIPFVADMNDLSLEGPSFNSPANRSLKKFITEVDSQRMLIQGKATRLQQLKNQKAADSIYLPGSKELDEKNASINNYIIKYIDTASSPVMALFALGYTRSIDPPLLEKSVNSLTKRFPKNATVSAIVAQYNQILSQYNTTPHEGSVAPDINLADTSGKPFALSMLRGKYVLIDFWASWCGPCRRENPNVVKAYTAYKDKNFTVLGISLDKEKAAWVEAIKKDQLNWYHISDLKQWETPVVNLYAFTSIPYNVLIDPKGVIIAQNLTGDDLENKLEEILK